MVSSSSDELTNPTERQASVAQNPPAFSAQSAPMPIVGAKFPWSCDRNFPIVTLWIQFLSHCKLFVLLIPFKQNNPELWMLQLTLLKKILRKTLPHNSLFVVKNSQFSLPEVGWQVLLSMNSVYVFQKVAFSTRALSTINKANVQTENFKKKLLLKSFKTRTALQACVQTEQPIYMDFWRNNQKDLVSWRLRNLMEPVLELLKVTNQIWYLISVWDCCLPLFTLFRIFFWFFKIARVIKASN